MNKETFKMMFKDFIKTDLEFQSMINELVVERVDRAFLVREMEEHEASMKELEAEVNKFSKDELDDEIKYIRETKEFIENANREIRDKNNRYFDGFPEFKINNFQLYTVYTYLIDNALMEGAFEDLISVCCFKSPMHKLNWIDKAGYNNKAKDRFTYVRLFDLFHNHIFQSDKKHFTHPKRAVFISNLVDGFLFDGGISSFNNINTAYTNWRFDDKLNIEL